MTSVRVLIVEDESIVSMDIQSTLESLGYDVVGAAATGEDAVSLATEKLPDIVLMDIVLKGDIDGIEAAERIRETMDLPIVYLTAYTDDDTLARAKLTDPFGYILKPFEERELHTNIEMALHKHRLETDLRESEENMRDLFDNSMDLIQQVGPEGEILQVNKAWLDTLGYTTEDLDGLNIFDIICPDHRDECMTMFGEVMSGKPLRGIETEFQRKDGSMIVVEGNVNALIEDGKVIHTRGFFRDITERKRAEELERERAKGEVYGFLVSALPVFAGSVPAQVRDELIKNFGERFEAQMRPRFIDETVCSLGEGAEQLPDFDCFVHWIQQFFRDVGIETEFKDRQLHFQACPWVEEARGNPVFCLVCRTMVMRSAGWTEEKVSVSHKATIAGGAETCCFEYNVSKNDNKVEEDNEDGE